VLDFLLVLSHGCRHPVDRIFACLPSPILCGVALWLAMETGLKSRTLAAWSGRGFRGLLSSLIVTLQFEMAIGISYLALLAGRCVIL